MREIAPLYAVLVLLSLAESLVWVRNGRQVLLAWRRGRHALLDGAQLPGTERGGFALLSPWPLVGEAFLCGGGDLTAAIAEPARGPESLRTALVACRTVLAPVRLASLAEWLTLFVVFPAVVAWRGLAASWPALLVLLLVAHATTLALAWRAHFRLFPEAAVARWGLTARLAVSPPAAVRSADAIGLPLFQREHPVALALAAGALRAASDAARRALIDARQNQSESELRRTFQAWKLNVSALLIPPRKEYDGCVAYCPRCLTQYTQRTTNCSSCPGVLLQPF